MPGIDLVIVPHQSSGGVLLKELAESGRPNAIYEHNRIAVETLIAGGATKTEARDLMAQSVWNLRKQGARIPTNIPWYK